MKTFVAIAGNMGAGKTSMVEFLAREYGFEPAYEPHTANPYLDDFYRDMRRWAFHSQLYFLTHRFRLHRGLCDRPGTVVQDRTIYEDAEIFAENLYRRRAMTKRDYTTYRELYESMREALRPPDLLVYLRCSVRAIRRRIRLRGRPSEMSVPVGYLRGLNALYETWVARYDLSPKLVWDSERMDFVTDLVDLIEFRRAIARLL